MQALQEPKTIQALFGRIAHRYDLANHLLSGGLDFLWRRRVARLVRSWAPERVLDLATGSGDLLFELQRHLQSPRAILENADLENSPQENRAASIVQHPVLIAGADFCLPMLRQAQRKSQSAFSEASSTGLAPNTLPLLAADGMALPFADATWDVVTIGFGLRNMADLGKALREIRRVLRPGGHVLILDFAIPSAPLRWLYRPYLHHILPRLAGFLTGERGAYEYLGASIEKFPAGEAMNTLLIETSFSSPKAEPLTGGIVALYTAQVPADSA